MTIRDIIAATTISEVFVALGGDRPERGRARAFWRTGADNPNAVGLDDRKGCWFDYRDQTGGGVLDLIQHVRGCDRGPALRWLADFVGSPLDDRPMTLTQRRNYARAAGGHEYSGATSCQLCERFSFITERHLTALSHVALLFEIDPAEALAKMHSRAHLLRSASARDIVNLWRAMPTEAVTLGATGKKNGEMQRRSRWRSWIC